MTGVDAFVDLAERLADAAAPIHRRYFRATTTVEAKADGSPVTAADREAEASHARHHRGRGAGPRHPG